VKQQYRRRNFLAAVNIKVSMVILLQLVLFLYDVSEFAVFIYTCRIFIDLWIQYQYSSMFYAS